MARFWEHLFALLPYWATFSPGRKLLRVPKSMEAHFTRIHFFCEILIGLPVRIRQACASPHQIVIWICFWLINWDGNAASQDQPRRSAGNGLLSKLKSSWDISYMFISYIFISYIRIMNVTLCCLCLTTSKRLPTRQRVPETTQQQSTLDRNDLGHQHIMYTHIIYIHYSYHIYSYHYNYHI